MLRLDRDALICDLVETYQIYDYKALPVSMLARLSCGLRDNSRIKMKIMGMRVPFETLVQVAILDDLRWLRWSKTEDARRKRNMPKPHLNSLLGNEEKKETVTAFSSPEEFEKRRAEIIGGKHE